MSADELTTGWQFFHFGLIVTGEGERDFLKALFRSLTALGTCTFEVIRQIGQRSPITSPKRMLRMVGSGTIIPDRDAHEIGIPARRYLQQRPLGYVVVVDDLEADRAPLLVQVYERYRKALDTMLEPMGLQGRASVHFLVNMLEAYYFADAAAINNALGTNLADYVGDVEGIGHPKGESKALVRGFDEIEHGRQIVACLDVERVLSGKDTCASLRSLFSWCWCAMGQSPGAKYLLESGIHAVITGRQIGQLSRP